MPPPVLMTVRFFVSGFDPTAVLNAKLDGSIPIFGCVLPPVTVRVTEIVCGELDASGAEMVIVSGYVPAGRLAILAETVIESACAAGRELLDDFDKVSQVALGKAVQLRFPPPEFETERLALGFVPPTVALRDIDEGLIPIAGGVLGIRFKVAETTCGAFAAPGAEKVI